MEPDVMRLYSSSPPPLDEGAEDEDDEFGEFGGFGEAMASSFSFSEMDVPPVAFDQSQASDTAPPELPMGSSAPGPQKASVVGRASSCDPPQQSDDEAQAEPERHPREAEVGGGAAETRSPCDNGGFGVPQPLVNGFPETDPQDASPPMTSPTTSALSSSCSSSSPCAQRQPQETDHNDTSHHTFTSGEGPSLANGFTHLHSHTEEGHENEALSTEEQEVLSVEGDSECTDIKETSVQPQSLSGSRLHTEASVPTGYAERPLGQEGGIPLEDRGSGCDDVRPALEEEEEEDLPTPSGPTQTSESDDFASFCEVVSPSDADDFGDFGHFSSTVAPPSSVTLSAGPAIEPPGNGDDDGDDDDDFGGFGEAGALSTQGFADFSQTEGCTQEGGFARFPSDFPTASSHASSEDSPAREEADGDQTLPAEAPTETGVEEEAAHEGSCPQEDKKEEERLGDLPVSDSFADFQSVPVGGGADDGEDWAAFGEPEGVGEQAGGGGDNWAAFGEEQPQAGNEQAGEKEEEEPQWQDGATATPPIYDSPHTSRRDSLTAPLSSRLQRLFQASFPHVEAHQVGEGEEDEGEDAIPALKAMLEPQRPADPADQQSNQPPSPAQREPRDMWRHLQDIHGAFGLKFLWGGSHSNRQLLRCLAVDTRNIVGLAVSLCVSVSPCLFAWLTVCLTSSVCTVFVLPPGHCCISCV
ncbi:hypothetical protein ACEWY4_020936 [Coilia grayii]|uniref:Aftiphilin clathrin-binding box domain-containing protein n=1 Tax=Coilia grayii TaxID=363190 RepID=A0ABD1JAY2_9TELE